ncbi:hypothetical protein DP939_36385 [Spongiactinospora rosea]|uniref:Uncharacterized protein n=1 Tax=Spongiactinospora rosea TaxID=2248750 RepID=A0A366LQ58_9ACTN|nr:hypothetical protein [Spongiactinospora rosea]RBQ15322.1 hypothetical protein DP939_36385 [Spongiactinospora rosea]
MRDGAAGVTKALADSACRTTVIDGGATLGIDLEVVRRDSAARGFTSLPRRCVAERTLGRLMLCRRLVRGNETLYVRSETIIHIDLMARRLTGEFTPRGAAPELGIKKD